MPKSLQHLFKERFMRMAPSQHEYKPITSNGESESEAGSEQAFHSTNERPGTSRRLKVSRLLPFVLSVMSILLFIVSTIQWAQTHSRNVPFSSSQDADPYFNFRYTTDLASQNDYREDRSRWKTPSGEWTSCGHSPHQARERGCKFDIMSAVWLPPPCYNETFAREAAAMHHGTNVSPPSVSPKTGVSMTNFTWHSDESLSPESYIPLDELEQFFIDKYDQGEPLIAYSIENFHVAHCLYMMRAALRGLERVAAGEKHVYVHEESMGRPHAEHCQHVLMNYEKWKHGVVALEFGMGWCKRVS